tara:strand:+ start:156 stop:1058 length:903 start_codon:yes stop_codon:yes gene_type:complete
MAKYSATTSTAANNIAGQKQDVEDVIYDISPTETPFTSSIGSSTANAVTHEWQEDSLAAAGDNFAMEGADAANTDVAKTSVKSNRCQIFTKDVSVTNTAERIGKYGRSSEMSYQIAKKGKELKRDIEHAFVGQVNAGAAETSTVGRKLTAATNQMHSDGITAVGGALTEAAILTGLQAVFTAGGNVNQIQVTPAKAVTVAGFATSASTGTTRDFGESKRMVNAVDFYVSPFGEAAVVTNRFLKSDTALLLDTDYWSRAVLRPMQTINLAVNGDSTKKQLITELTLVCENSKASGALQGIT